MDENFINEINKKIENLIERCDVLERENKIYKETIKKNQSNILNLLKLQEKLRDEYKNKINELQNNYNEKIQNLNQKILKNENENEIINDIENNNNNLFYLKKIKEEIINIVEERLQNFKKEIYIYVGQNGAKEKKEKKEDIIKYKDKNVINQFENKLYNIFCEKGQEIPDKDIKELKKLGTVIVLKYKKSPLDISKSFIEKNLNIGKEMDEIFQINSKIKTGKIILEMNDILIRKLDKLNPTEFLKNFKEKYGIEENEIKDKELKKILNKNNNDEIKTIEAILKKLKYINHSYKYKDIILNYL